MVVAVDYKPPSTLDPSGLIRRVQIFRVGTHTASNGFVRTYSQSEIDQIAENYNPDIHEAPLIIGHAYGTSPAFGWVKKLYSCPGYLEADVWFHPEIVDAVRQKLYQKFSVGLYTEESPANPYPGTLSLRELTILGAQPPAVKALASIQFAEEEGVLHFDEQLNFMHGVSEAERSYRFIATIFQRLRDHFIDKEGIDATDKVLPADLVQMIYDSANMPDARFEMLGQLMMRVSELEQQISQQPTYTEKHMTEEKELEFAEKQRQLEIQQAELAKQAGLLAKRQAELDRKEDLDFCEGLIKEGKVLPKERTNLMAIFSSLRKSDSTVNFGEGDLSAVEAVKNFVKEHPPVIAFGEFSAPEKALPRSNSNFDVPDGYDVDPDQLELHQKAEAYMEAHPGTDFLKAIQKIGG